MIRLLVSVRDAAEARFALEGGAEIIDVKEPHRGALGAADPQVVREVIQAIGRRVPVSVALGELLEWPIGGLEIPPGPVFAKVGLAGCGNRRDWVERWTSLHQKLGAAVELVGVIYGDWELAETPHPREIIDIAGQLAIRTVLIDTYNKSRGALLDRVESWELRAWCEAIRKGRGTVVLAGSMSLESIDRAAEFKPDIVAIRGAACDGDRTATVSRSRVAEFAHRLKTTNVTDQFA